MPHRTLNQTSFFDPEVADPSCLEPGTVPWLLGTYRSCLFPSWLCKGWRGEKCLGRKAWPAIVLMVLIILRWTEEGMSRRASIRQAKRNTTWRAAMGLAIGAPTPDEKTVREFERFLRQRHPEAGVVRAQLIHEHIVRLCLDEGIVDDTAVFAMDSTPMIRRAKALYDQMWQVLADTAYGGASFRCEVQEQYDVKVLAPPPEGNNSSKKAYNKNDFAIDFSEWTATCPQGVTSDDVKWGPYAGQSTMSARFVWSKETCAQCPLKSDCPTVNSRQGIRLHPDEEALRLFREEWKEPQVREQYRVRSLCERLVNQMTRHGARRARAWGLGSAVLQSTVIAMRCNLGLLAKALAAKEACPIGLSRAA